MLMFTQYVLLLTSLLSSVLTLPLVRRDVVDPPITSPTAGTIWHVGQTQTVTWNSTGLPVNQTNPRGMLVLGYLFNNSEHLMLNSPLATNLNYSVGQAQITVPNVPTRSDYIIVLFGDSGNASPEFTIINDASSSSAPVAPSSGPTSLPSSTPTATSPPTASPSNPAQSPTAMTTPPATAPAPSSLSTITSHIIPSNTSTVVVVTASSTSSSSKSSAAWQNRVPSLGTSLSVALGVVYFAFS
ncbi:hypothetical protein EV363DRAFT_1324997 [Boletus edulis]|nr:hypothetical protein EV363DRAFT_1324997 [Boletus edulis]